MESQLINNMDMLEKLFNSRLQEMEQKLDKATVAPSSPTPDLSKLTSEFHEFKAFIWQMLTTMKSQIELLTLGLDRHETAMRRKVLLIHGIPEKQNEKVHDAVMKVFVEQLKLSDVVSDSIRVCHRLGSLQGKPRPILVRFNNMEHRHLVWDNKTALKGTGTTISEFLTKARHNVFSAARAHFGMKQCWTIEGKITIFLPDKTRQKIESMDELQLLITKYPREIAEPVGKTVAPAKTKKPTKDSEPHKTRRRN